MCEASGAVALPEGSFGDRFLMIDNEDNILRIYAVGDPAARRSRPTSARPRSVGQRPRRYRPRGGDLARRPGRAGRHHSAGRGTAMAAARRTGCSCRSLWTATSPDQRAGRGTSDAARRRWRRSTQTSPPRSATSTRGSRALAEEGRHQPRGHVGRRRRRLAVSRLSGTRCRAAIDAGQAPQPQGRAVRGRRPAVRAADPARPRRAAASRSMEYSPAAGAYFIVAGPVDGGAGFDIYRWVEGGSRSPVPGAARGACLPRRLRPGGLIIDQTGKRLQLFSDNTGLRDQHVPRARC